VVTDLTVGTLAADIWIGLAAGVTALELDTGLVLAAVIVPGALSVAPGESVSQKVRRALAVGAVVAGLAQSVLSANSVSADWDALEALALFALGAVTGGLALALALSQRVADVVLQAFADGGVVWADFALGVNSALFANLIAVELPASLEWVPGASPGAPADGDVVPGRAVGAVSATEGARVNATEVLASLVLVAVLVGSAVTPDASDVGVSGVSVRA